MKHYKYTSLMGSENHEMNIFIAKFVFFPSVVLSFQQVLLNKNQIARCFAVKNIKTAYF